MPAIAEVMAIDSAPTRPASSNRGANARPVAGPPVSVAEPASTPNIGSSPNDVATPIPTRFCTTAYPDATARNTITCLPLIFSSATEPLPPLGVQQEPINAPASPGPNRNHNPAPP